MRVLVTGGAGYIGSVVTEELIAYGHEAVVYDNLSQGHRGAVHPAAKFIKGELEDRATLRRALADNRVETVIHMAADALVGESAMQPAKYYRNNVAAALILLDAMRDAGVSSIVFSSSAAIYGEAPKQPIEETDPAQPTNPYGETKFAFERALHWYNRAHDLRYVTLRYFNAAGATERCGEWHDPETHLVPLILQTAAGQREQVEVYGDDYPTRDGTCVRDYVHVRDLARAHVLALETSGGAGRIYNLGCSGEGYTVREVIEAAREVTGRRIPVRTGARRDGDPAVLVANSDRIKSELGWRPETQDLRTVIESAWRWMETHPRGYAGHED